MHEGGERRQNHRICSWHRFGYAFTGPVSHEEPCYKGRVGIYEFMPLSLETKQMISANADLNQLRAQAKKEKVEPLRIAGARKVLAGMTTLEEVLRVVPLN